jgi:predicted DCC family thiol-disulfide oxidoreductase YuxK
MFYDGDCKVCRLTTRLVLAADTRKRLRSIPIGSPEADPYLGHLSKKERFGSFHLYGDGRLLSGAEAIGPLMELLPPMSAAGRLLGRSERARGASAWLYRGIAGRRALIGRFLPSVRPPSR